MIQAGMNVARLNFSHGTYNQFESLLKNVKQAAKELKTTVAILQDLQGPKIRIGKLSPKGITIKRGQLITLSTKPKPSKGQIPIQYKGLPKDVSKGDRILVNDGLIEVKVQRKTSSTITCKVITGGTILSNKGINVPTASIRSATITAKDKRDLKFGLKNNVDFVALSFVKDAKDIEALRKLIRAQKGRAKIIAKIERHEAVENPEEIIHEADGVMVARGDLGVEVSLQKVPIIQKKLIHMANLHGKPVITATEMLQSMVVKARPTRAEVSDVANAIFDHTDAIMLSNESSVGKHPVKAVQTLTKIAKSTEDEMRRHSEFLPNRLFEGMQPISYVTCSSAAKLAQQIKAKAIVAITQSGFTAQHIAKHRVQIPIIAITEDLKVEKQLQLVWGVDQTIFADIKPAEPETQIRKILLSKKVARKGDTVVVVTNASQSEKSISAIVL